ncbi:Kynurenine formamidase [Chionoecetes opilio]|uniref:Kynurenine formamidase n=1 Tax=Chionoecetes opilio TaxID=41210 RepID=A0A8J4YGP3_CHIOP|nr:Kynurenine formamidase [Chionoecetes opilio]
MQELERQYSPSQWSERHSSGEVIPIHFEKAKERSETARQTVLCRQDVVYDDALPRGLLDVYGEDLPKGAPVVLYVHGGYWQELDKGVSAYLVPPLVKAGRAVGVVVGYDLAPAVSVADIVVEVRKAVVWACALACGRGSVGVVLAGWSAGAHLITQATLMFTVNQGFHGQGNPDVTVNQSCHCQGNPDVTVNQCCHGQGNPDVTVNQSCHCQGNPDVTVNQGWPRPRQP